MNVKDIIQVDYKTYYSEEFMFKFTKWCDKHHTRLVRGWVKNSDFFFNSPGEIYTTKELLEEFKKSKDAVSE